MSSVSSSAYLHYHLYWELEVLFLHPGDNLSKKMYMSLQIKLSPPLTENNVENFIYVSSTEQNKTITM